MTDPSTSLPTFSTEMKEFFHDFSVSTSKDLADFGGFYAIGARPGMCLQFKNMEQFAIRASSFTKEEIQQILTTLLDNEIGDIIASELIADLYGRVSEDDFEFIISHERLNFPF